jgi:hypothetical protein
MEAHITGTGMSERRAKGKNNKPKVYFTVEVFLLALVVYLISFAQIKFLTVLSAIAAVFFVIMSCVPRYKKIVARQTKHKVHNHTPKTKI